MGKQVALIGNVGNCTYWYVKYLREAGVDATLYITFKKYKKDGFPEFAICQDPRAEDKELGSELPNWIKTFYVGSFSSILKNLKEFEKYDLNIAFESTCAFIQFVKKPMMVFATGNNLREDAFKKDIKGFLLRRGFSKAKLVLFDNIDTTTLDCFKSLKISKVKWVPCIVPFKESICGAPEGSVINKEFFENIKESFIFFSPSRLDYNVKGTNILLNGFSSFIRRNPNSAKLIMIDYGLNKDEVKEDIKRMGLSENIMILPVLSKGETIKLMEGSSAVLGYFADGESGTHHFPFAVMDPLNLGKIPLSSLDSAAFLKITEEEPKVIKAFTHKEVEEKMDYIVKNFNELSREFGFSGPHWINKHLSKDIIVCKLKEAINSYE